MSSWKNEVIADSASEWHGNAFRFATPKEARDYMLDLSLRWTLARDTFVVESNEPVNYSYIDGHLRYVGEGVAPIYSQKKSRAAIPQRSRVLLGTVR